MSFFLKCTSSFCIEKPDGDCYEVKKSGRPLPGIYSLKIDSETTVDAYCEVDGWTIVQARGQFNNAKEYFQKNWQEYQVGFGVPGTLLIFHSD